MKTSAHAAVARASRIFGTVKKRMMMWGSPAVPTISAAAVKRTSIRGRTPPVKEAKPRSRPIPSSASRSVRPAGAPSQAAPSGVSTLPGASGTSGFPVRTMATKMAGTRYATMITTYCVTWTAVIPFIPPVTAKRRTSAAPIVTAVPTPTSRNRASTSATPRIWPAT
jgi:hypothetical protein